MALGIVLAPYGKIPGSFPYAIASSRGTRQQYLSPDDPQFYSSGEAGYYYDTPLGASRPGFFARMKAKLGLGDIPTDFEMAVGNKMPYQPSNAGWIAAKQGYFAPPWEPPYGQPSAGMPLPIYTPGIQPLHGLGDVGPMTLAPVAATTDDVIQLMNAHNDRVFALALVSTTAVAVSALLTVFRTLKLIRDDK